MANGQLQSTLRHIRRMAGAKEYDALSDRQLLERFATRREEEAFVLLLQRHAGMVLGVCRRVLRDHHEAEDVFQATFLVLARQAGSGRWRESVGPWLHEVAYRLAMKTRADAVRRRAAVRSLEGRSNSRLPDDGDEWELRAVLDEELRRLPEQLRSPVVLCYLEGKTNAEAATLLGWRMSTLKGRLARARERLRGRLTRRGLALSAAVLVEHAAPSSVSPTLLASTARVATLLALEETAAATGVSVQVATLADGMLHAMWVSKVKVAAATLLLLCLVGAGMGWAQHAFNPRLAEVAQEPDPPRPEEPANNRVDTVGDPLPEEAVSRMGTARLRHGRGIGFLGFTPAGKTLVSQSGDGVRAWEAATGKQIHFLPNDTKRDGWWGWATLTAAGKLLATPSNSGIHLWEVGTSRRVRILGSGRYHKARFSPDGKLLAARGSMDSAHVEVWDTTTGQQRWGSRSEERVLPWFLDFTGDGKTLITVDFKNPVVVVNAGGKPQRDYEHTLRFWDSANGHEQRRTELGSFRPSRMTLSPNGTLLAAIYDDEKRRADCIRIWELATGKQLHDLVPSDNRENVWRNSFSALAFTPDGKALITAGQMESLLVWDLATGKELRKLARGFGGSQALAFSPDGKTLAAGGSRGLIRLMDWSTGEDRFPQLVHHHNIHQLAITTDGQTVVTARVGPTFPFWNTATGRELRRVEVQGGADKYWLAPDGRTVFLGRNRESSIRVQDLATGEQRMLPELKGSDKKVFTVHAIAPDNKTIAVGPYAGNVVHIVDASTGRVLQRFDDAKLEVYGGDFLSDCRTLFLYCGDQTVQVWDAVKGVKLRQIGPLGEHAYGAEPSPDGRLLAYGDEGGVLALFDAGSGEKLRRLEGSAERAVACAFSPDGRMVACGGRGDAVVSLAEVATGKERHRLLGHTGHILSLRFSADGKKLVSGSDDTTAIVWDLTGRLAAKENWAKPLTPANLDACWAMLASADAAEAYQAIRRLAASPAHAVPFLGRRLQPVSPVGNEHLTRLIADLDSDQFAVRDGAAKQLIGLGELALAACREALNGQPSEETRRRLDAVVEKQTEERRTPSGETLLSLRAVEVLEQCGITESRQVLSELAKGAAAARLTEEAKASLERLTRRSGVAP